MKFISDGEKCVKSIKFYLKYIKFYPFREDEECIEDTGGKARRKETTRKTNS
jgi:hypothetical protein